MKRLLLVAILTALIAVLPVFSNAGEPAKPAADEAKIFPEINLLTLDGDPVKRGDLKGEIYIVDFWATWCGPCIVEVPNYNALQAKYGDKGLRILGVTMASGDGKEVKPYVNRYKMKYSILMIQDEDNSPVARDLNLMGFPTTFVVTKDWKIYKRYNGVFARKAAALDVDIQTLLNAKAE